MLCSYSGNPFSHQSSGLLGNDDLLVQRNVVAVRMRDKGKPPCIRRVEPKILFRQINALLVMNINHRAKFTRETGEAKLWDSSICIPHIDIPPVNRFHYLDEVYPCSARFNH